MNLHKYTYRLGRSLYIPVTSKCNSIPLPVTRGPNFILDRDVVDVLLGFRRAGFDDNKDYNGGTGVGSNGKWRTLGSDNNDDDDRVSLPEYNLPLVTSLYPPPTGEKRKNIEMKEEEEDEDLLEPSIASLVEEVKSHLHVDDDGALHEVCIAGEGEPTLRMDALLAIARTVQSFNREQQIQHSNNNNNSSSNNDNDNNGEQQPRQIPVRVITNGLCYSIPNFGYSYNGSKSNEKENFFLQPKLRYKILRDLTDAGVSSLSVALNTSNRHEYDILMQPACYTGGGVITSAMLNDYGEDDDNNNDMRRSGSNNNNNNELMMMPGTAHDLICEFIMDATRLGLDVEITGVDRPGIDKVEMERLARLLLSVGPKKNNDNNMMKKRRNGRRGGAVRWRPYFS